MWDNESKFSTYLYRRLNAEGMYVHRLESHGTGNGLPDMFIMGHGDDFFLELKNDKKITVAKAMAEGIKVDWRPGQQAWALTYKQRHATLEGGKMSATIVGVKDGILLIPMKQLFNNDVVWPTSIFSIGEHSCIYDMLCTTLYYRRAQ